MTVIRTSRFTTDPSRTKEMLTRRADLISAIRAAHPGLAEARLARVGEDTWVDAWRWDSPASLQAALAAGPSLPEAAPVFAVIRDLTTEDAELVDER
jgi:hypothetical protein